MSLLVEPGVLSNELRLGHRHLFKVYLNPEALDVWNALPPRTRGSLERQLSGMAKVIGFREMLTDAERYGSVRTGKIEVLYELDPPLRLLRVYEVRRHAR